MNRTCFLTLKGKGDNKVCVWRGREGERMCVCVCVREREREREREKVSSVVYHTVRPETLSAVREWLKQLPSQGLEAVDCGSYTLDEPQIVAIEKAVLDVQVRTLRNAVFTWKRACFMYTLTP